MKNGALTKLGAGFRDTPRSFRFRDGSPVTSLPGLHFWIKKDMNMCGTNEAQDRSKIELLFYYSMLWINLEGELWGDFSESRNF
jgi:hypothetical protein